MACDYPRYLRLLGISGRPAGLDGLRTVVRRHLAAVPFENSASYALSSTFMRCLRIGRVFDGYSLDLIDRALYRHEGEQTTVTHLDTMEDLKAAVQDQFGMPRCPIESAISILERLTGTPLFA